MPKDKRVETFADYVLSTYIEDSALFLPSVWAEIPSYSVNGRFRVKTTEVRRVHVHSSLLVVTSNKNASNKKKNRLNIYPKRECHIIYPV